MMTTCPKVVRQGVGQHELSWASRGQLSAWPRAGSSRGSRDELVAGEALTSSRGSRQTERAERRLLTAPRLRPGVRGACGVVVADSVRVSSQRSS
jgi:hypothetical protein